VRVADITNFVKLFYIYRNGKNGNTKYDFSKSAVSSAVHFAYKVTLQRKLHFSETTKYCFHKIYDVYSLSVSLLNV